jgi:hypothetical protein
MRFTDQNGDGKIDVMQIDHTSHHLTAWIDTDYDGLFDRRVSEDEGIEVDSAQVSIPVPVRPQ